MRSQWIRHQPESWYWNRCKTDEQILVVVEAPDSTAEQSMNQPKEINKEKIHHNHRSMKHKQIKLYRYRLFSFLNEHKTNKDLGSGNRG